MNNEEITKPGLWMDVADMRQILLSETALEN